MQPNHQRMWWLNDEVQGSEEPGGEGADLIMACAPDFLVETSRPTAAQLFRARLCAPSSLTMLQGKSDLVHVTVGVGGWNGFDAY